jgi:hypothetical protein
VVKAALLGPKSVWTCMWKYFHNDPARVDRWTALRDDAGVPDHLSVLRAIDVVLWMRERHHGL